MATVGDILSFLQHQPNSSEFVVVDREGVAFEVTGIAAYPFELDEPRTVAVLTDRLPPTIRA